MLEPGNQVGLVLDAIKKSVLQLSVADLKELAAGSDSTRSHISSVGQSYLLNCIKDQPKLKHIKDIPSVVNNLNNFGVISTADSEILRSSRYNSTLCLDSF